MPAPTNPAARCPPPSPLTRLCARPVSSAAASMLLHCALDGALAWARLAGQQLCATSLHDHPIPAILKSMKPWKGAQAVPHHWKLALILASIAGYLGLAGCSR